MVLKTISREYARLKTEAYWKAAAHDLLNALDKNPEMLVSRQQYEKLLRGLMGRQKEEANG